MITDLNDLENNFFETYSFLDLWFDFGYLVKEFVCTMISFQSIHENYQSQNLHNEQVALSGAQENSILNTGTVEEEESVLESNKFHVHHCQAQIEI